MFYDPITTVDRMVLFGAIGLHLFNDDIRPSGYISQPIPLDAISFDSFNSSLWDAGLKIEKRVFVYTPDVCACLVMSSEFEITKWLNLKYLAFASLGKLILLSPIMGISKYHCYLIIGWRISCDRGRVTSAWGYSQVWLGTIANHWRFSHWSHQI